jgi:hypothetical protein
MMRAVLAAMVLFGFSVGSVHAQCAVPNNLTNGTTADATQVMGNFNALLSCVNTGTNVLRSYIAGLGLANDTGNAKTVIDIAAGMATSDDNTTSMTVAAPVSKNANAAWAVGSTNGCLDSGTSLSPLSWYHIFVIERTDTGVVDQLCSISVSATALPTSYTKKRRIGSFRTDGSSHILGFVQDEETFWWRTQVQDFNNSIGTTATPVPLSTPSGVQTRPILRILAPSTQTGVILLTSPDETDVASGTGYSVTPGFDEFGTNSQVAAPYLYTDTSSHIRARASAASTSMALYTRGYVDSRGKFQ